MKSSRRQRSREEAAYEELQSYSLAHGEPEFLHQHVVDAWAAQWADDSTRPISLTFALVGLYLHVVRGFSGRLVQRVHTDLSRRRRDWPSLRQPTARGAMTASQVMTAAPGIDRDQAIDAWCASVWEAYRDCHAEVKELLRQHGID